MSSEFLSERGKGLEDAFFAKQDALLRKRLLELEATQSGTAALSQASGIKDPKALEQLEKAGVSAASVAALSLIPLVAVAWADGKVDQNERTVLLTGAETAGIGKTDAAYGLFESWLAKAPGPDMMAAWTHYVAALPADTRAALKPDILKRARTVAEAGGGFLQLGNKVSAAEEAVLTKLEAAFA